MEGVVEEGLEGGEVEAVGGEAEAEGEREAEVRHKTDLN